MKTKKIYYLASALVITGMILFFSCKKDKTNANTNMTSSQVNEAQQSESDDATADKIEQDLDNNLDQLESNGYSTSSAKSAISSCVTISIDSTTIAGGWPRTVKLDYDCFDTINGEHFSQTGEIVVFVQLIKKTNAGKLFKRTITFNNYKVATDSSQITLNGSRTLTRINILANLNAEKTLLRYVITDSINSNMSFTEKFPDTTITFTRMVDRERVANLHLRKIIKRWYAVLPDDSITLSGPVTGINARGFNYIRNISTPLLFTFCPLWPHNIIISKGQIDLSNSSGAVGTITYAANGCKTTVTLTVNGKSKIINRKFGRKFRRWW